MPSVSTDAPILHFDAGEILKHQITPEGYLRCYMRIAKVGDLTYMNPDGSKRIETVTPEVLFNKDSIDSFKMKPITLEHPAELVNSRNARRYQRGLTGHHAVIDSNFLGIVGTITDREMVDSVLRGDTQETSCGYEASVNHADGKFFQGFRKGNHVAGTRKGRAGEEIGFHIDSVDEYWSLLKDDAWREDYDESFVNDVLQVPSKTKFFTQAPDALVKDSIEPQESASAEISAQPKGKQPMTYTLQVGNRPIVLDSADDAEAINALIAKADSLQAKLDAKKMTDDEYDDGDDEEPDGNEDDNGGKKMPPWMKKKMAKKDSEIAKLNDRIDSLNAEIETKDGQISVLETIVGRTDSEEEAPAEHMDAEAIAAEVQSRLDAMFEAYEDAKPYLPADYKLDGNATPSTIQAAALSSLGEDFKLDSEEAIAGAYQTMKRFAKRQDSSTQLNTVLYQTLPTMAKQDSAPRTIAEYARLDSNDPALASLDFRTLAQVASYRAGRQPINPGAN